MRLETILNRLEKHTSFVYGSGHLEDGPSGLALVVPLRPRRNGRAVCAGCGAHGPTHDHLAERRFADLPLWGGDRAVFRVPDASGELRSVRGDGGAGSVVRREAFADDAVSLVSGQVGAATELEHGPAEPQPNQPQGASPGLWRTNRG